MEMMANSKRPNECVNANAKIVGHCNGNSSRSVVGGSHWPKVFLLFLLAVTLPSQPSEAIRGALFRSGRSPAFAPISGGHFVNLGSDEEERLLSLAPHPALMVDLRQLMAFSRATESQQPQAIIRPIPRENTVAGTIVPTKRAQKMLSPPPTITLGQQWKSPRLSAFLAMARKYGNPPQMQEAEEWMN